MPPEYLQPEKLSIDYQRDVKDRPVVGTNCCLVSFIQELPDALREHFGDVGQRVERRILENLKPVIVDELPIKRIEVGKRAYRKQAGEHQPLALPCEREGARLFATLLASG